MQVKGKALTIGTAGVVALGATGLYAGSLATAASGNLGAGSVTLHASCSSTADITPGDSAWNQGAKQYQFNRVKVSIENNAQCAGQEASLNIYDTSAGNEVSKNATAKRIDNTENSTGAFWIDLDTPVSAGIAEIEHRYGIVIEAPQADGQPAQEQGPQGVPLADRSDGLSWPQLPADAVAVEFPALGWIPFDSSANGASVAEKELSFLVLDDNWTVGDTLQNDDPRTLVKAIYYGGGPGLKMIGLLSDDSYLLVEYDSELGRNVGIEHQPAPIA